MALTFKFFTDVGLTAPVSAPILASQNDAGTTPAIETQLWFGSATAGVKAQALSDPGVDQITISVTDATPGASHLPTEIKLALTQGGLAAATPGAALDLGVTVTSAVPVEFWAQIDDATLLVSTETDLGLTTNTLKETAV